MAQPGLRVSGLRHRLHLCSFLVKPCWDLKFLCLYLVQHSYWIPKTTHDDFGEMARSGRDTNRGVSIRTPHYQPTIQAMNAPIWLWPRLQTFFFVDVKEMNHNKRPLLKCIRDLNTLPTMIWRTGRTVEYEAFVYMMGTTKRRCLNRRSKLYKRHPHQKQSN